MPFSQLITRGIAFRVAGLGKGRRPLESVEITPPHPIVFVFDPTNADFEISDLGESQLIGNSETCVSIGVRANVDGNTIVQFLDGLGRPPNGRLERLFQGTVYAPGNQLAIVTSENDVATRIAIANDRPRLEVWVDDIAHPGRVVVCVGK